MPSVEERVPVDPSDLDPSHRELLQLATTKQKLRSADDSNEEEIVDLSHFTLEDSDFINDSSVHSLSLRIAHNNSGLATVLENVPLYSASGPATCRFTAYRTNFDVGEDDLMELICIPESLQTGEVSKEMSNDSGMELCCDSLDANGDLPNCSISLSDQLDCCPMADSTSDSDPNCSSRGGVLNWPSPRSFHKTHARHYSYDVTHCGGKPSFSHIVIGGSLVGVGSGGSYCCPVLGDRLNRTNSLTRTDGSSLSSSFSVSSLSFSDYSASLASINNDLGEDQTQTNPNSKQNSLDRRSFASTEAQWAEFMRDEQRDESALEENFVTAKLKNGLSNILSKGIFSSWRSTTNGCAEVTNGSGLGIASITRGGGGHLAPSPKSFGHRREFSVGSCTSSVSAPEADTLSKTAGDNQPESSGWRFRVPGLSGRSLSGNHLSTAASKSTLENPVSTTALILENRPGNLPAKSSLEAEKHRRQYEQMVEAAKKKEQRDLKLKKKQLETQLKHEESLAAAVREWTTEILPNWSQLRDTKRVRDLWWQGLPPSVRGKVWKLAIGNDLNITMELYEICCQRAKEKLDSFSHSKTQNGHYHHQEPVQSVDPDDVVDRENTVELIHLDVARTFPSLGIFQKGGPYYDLLLNLLGGYVCYRPDVGYVQGMSFLAAVLILNMDVPDAFVCFANLLNRPCQIAFYRMNQNKMDTYFAAFDAFFLEYMPKLHAHFRELEVTPNLYLLEWLFTLYAKSLPLDVACRIWDLYLRDGEELLFRTALGLLSMNEGILLKLDFDHVVQLLTHLLETISLSQELFQCIEQMKRSPLGTREKRKFAQILSEMSAATVSSPSTSTLCSPSPSMSNISVCSGK